MSSTRSASSELKETSQILSHFLPICSITKVKTLESGKIILKGKKSNNCLAVITWDHKDPSNIEEDPNFNRNADKIIASINFTYPKSMSQLDVRTQHGLEQQLAKKYGFNNFYFALEENRFIYGFGEVYTQSSEASQQYRLCLYDLTNQNLWRLRVSFRSGKIPNLFLLPNGHHGIILSSPSSNTGSTFLVFNFPHLKHSQGPEQCYPLVKMSQSSHQPNVTQELKVERIYPLHHHKIQLLSNETSFTFFAFPIISGKIIFSPTEENASSILWDPNTSHISTSITCNISAHKAREEKQRNFIAQKTRHLKTLDFQCQNATYMYGLEVAQSKSIQETGYQEIYLYDPNVKKVWTIGSIRCREYPSPYTSLHLITDHHFALAPVVTKGLINLDIVAFPHLLMDKDKFVEVTSRMLPLLATVLIDLIADYCTTVYSNSYVCITRNPATLYQPFKPSSAASSSNTADRNSCSIQ